MFLVWFIKRAWAACAWNLKLETWNLNDNIFSLNESAQINPYKAKSKDFYYNLGNVKIHTDDQMGPKYWSQKISLNKDVWTRNFISLKTFARKLN